jgi:hypothetical protein
MPFIRRVVAVLVLLVSTVVFVASLIGAGAAWPVRTRLHDLTTKLSGRVEEVVGVVTRGAGQAEAIAVKAQDRLTEFETARAKDTAAPGNRVALQLAAFRLKSEYPSQITEMHENVTLAAQAAVVADSVLENADAWPLDAGARLDADRLKDVSDRLGQAAVMAQDLSDMLEESPEGQPLPAAVADRQSRIAEALQAVLDAIHEFQGRVADFAAKEQALKPRVLYWIDAGAVIAIVALLWIALSQVSVMAHAWGWLHGRRPAGERGA